MEVKKGWKLQWRVKAKKRIEAIGKWRQKLEGKKKKKWKVEWGRRFKKAGIPMAETA